MLPRPTVLVVANRRNHAVLVEQGEPAIALKDALDHEHHVRAAGVVFVEDERDRPLQGPRHDALLELRHLQVVAHHDRIFSHQVEAADVTIQIDAHARPVEPGCHLFDVRRLACAVQPLDHDPAVAGEAGEDGGCHFRVEAINLINFRNVVVGLAEGGHHQVRIDAEHSPYRDHFVRLVHSARHAGCAARCTAGHTISHFRLLSRVIAATRSSARPACLAFIIAFFFFRYKSYRLL
jgi:hypothetical protein